MGSLLLIAIETIRGKMMFDGYDDKGEIPTEADVGKFIPRKEM